MYFFSFPEIYIKQKIHNNVNLGKIVSVSLDIYEIKQSFSSRVII